MASRFAALALAVAVLIPAPGLSAEQLDTMNGWLEVVWSDAEAASDPAPPPMFLLTKDDGTTVTLVVDEAVLREAGGVFAVNRRQVSLSGAWQNNASGVPRAFEVQSVNPRRMRGAEAEAAPGGSQAWISILCKFSDSLSEPRSLDYFQNMYADTHPGLGHYWREQSYDLVNIAGSNAAGWFTLPQPRSAYVYDMNLDGIVDFDLVQATQDCTTAADPSVHFPAYAGINMMFNEPLDCCARGGGFYLTRDGVSKTWMTTWLPPWAYIKLALTSHEMGHGFGFPHSSGTYGATYDNKWDVMSAPSTGCEIATDPTFGCLGQHTIAYHKSKVGWIPLDRQYFFDSQMATIELEQTALPQTGSHRMAHVPIPGTSRYYTVEVRRQVGYDAKLPGQGVIIHEVEEGRASPARVLDPDGNGDTGDAGAIFTVGEVFQDNENKVSIGVGSATETGFIVTLAQNFITMTLTSSMNPSLPGAPVTFTATVSNGATGNVTFKEDGSILGTVALSDGTAAFSKSFASAGSHVISAEYSGDIGSASGQLTQTIVNQALTIGDVAVVEGNSGTTNAVFTVSMSAASAQTVSVGYATADGTAVGGQTFPGGSTIAIPKSGNGSPYPSAIAVAGLSGTIAKVTVGLQGLSHAWPADVDILLVGPAGQSVILMSDAGSSTGISDVRLTFDDAAATPVNYFTISSGTYTPTNHHDGEGGDAFGAPAPAAPYGSQLSVFNGTSPNGTWQLFVVDDVVGDSGSITGWSLTIATTGGDYFPASGFLTFAPGVVSQTITVPVSGDAVLEPDETFFVNLGPVWNAAILDAQGQGSIANDDATVAPPTNVVASAVGTASVNVTWNAVPGVSLYRVYRSSNNSLYTLVGSSTGTPSFTDSTVSPNTAYLYRVRSVAAEESADSNSDLATTVTFTDAVLSGTRVKSLHFTELLGAVNAVRALAGQSSIAFTAPAPAASVRIKRQHILDLRDGLNAARSALTLSAPVYVDPTITAGTTGIKSAHLVDLRNGVQ